LFAGIVAGDIADCLPEFLPRLPNLNVVLVVVRRDVG
jgi:hypothetical protein